MRFLVIAITTTIAMLIDTVCLGFIFSKGWGWFVAPKFGLPLLTVREAGGIGLTAEILFLSYMVSLMSMSAKKPGFDTLIENIINKVVIIYPVTLAFMYVWHLL